MYEYKVPSFLTRDGDALLFNGDGELIFYIPETYFSGNNAYFVGEYVNLIGIFDYSVFDANGKNNGLHRFNFPSVFLAKPYATEKQKGIRLTESQSVMDYRLLRFKKGDAVVVSVRVPQANTNIEAFYKLFLYGKLPKTIPVDKLHEYFVDNIELNGNSYGVSTQMFGFVFSEMCRSPKDLSVPFRNTNYTDPTSYTMIPIMDLPKYISPHQSLGSQNYENALVGAITNPTDVESPLEKILMGG